MKNIIIVDTTSTITIDEAKENNFILIPLNINIDSKSFLDTYEINYFDLRKTLEEGKLPTTSQPSVGYIEDIFEKLKNEDYNHIYVLTLSAGLSGTYQSFNLAKESVGLKNITIIDTKTVGCPIKNLAYTIKKMSEENKNHEEIMTMVNKHIEATYSFLYPSDLKHLKRGGRISPLAYGLASLLKIKPLLLLKKDGSTIEKFDTFKTEKKLYNTLFENLKEKGFNTKTHKLCLPHSLSQEKLNFLIEIANEHFDNLEYESIELPAVLLCHAGLDAVAIQSVLK